MTYLWFAAPRLLPNRKGLVLSLTPGRHREFVTELVVPPGSPVAGSSVASALGDVSGLRVLQLIRGEEIP